MAAAGTSSNQVSPYGTYTDAFSATRFLLNAALQGQWTQENWTFSPEARFSYFEETSKAYTDGLGIPIPAVSSGLAQIAVGPAIAYRFVTDGEITIDTGVKVSGILDFRSGAGAPGFNDLHGRVEGKIGLALPGGAHMGLSLAYDGIGSDGLRTFGGTVRLTAPLR